MNAPCRIVLAVEELDGIHGGVERTVVTLANHFAQAGHETIILTFEEKRGIHPVYELSPLVIRHYLGLNKGRDTQRELAGRNRFKSFLPTILTGTIQNVLAIRRIVKANWREIPQIVCALRELNPQVVISFKTHFHRYMVPAATRVGVPIIASEHNPPEILYYQYLSAVDRHVTWRLLRKATKIRLLLGSFCNGYPQSLREKCVDIPNGVDIPKDQADVRSLSSKNIILNVGRLYFQKSQITLVEAFAQLAPHYPEWILQIYGDGPLRDDLKGKINSLGLENRIFLMGPTEDATRCFLTAKIFALPSRFEGFGNVTLEALSCGLPVVAFDDIEANRVLVSHCETGFLVSSKSRVDAMAQALERLMSDEMLRVAFGNSARLSAKRFEKSAIMIQWDKLIEDSLSHAP